MSRNQSLSKSISFGITIFTLLLLGSATTLLAQEDADTYPYPIKGMITISPSFYKFDIPDGEIRLPGKLDRVITTDEENNRVVARVHVRVGKNFVVMLPNGTLVARFRNQVDTTEKPFVPATHDEIAQQIIDDNGFKGYQIEKTKNFVLIYNASPQFAKVTATTMQTMLEGVLKYTREQGIDTKEPEIPLPVLAFNTTNQFQAFRKMPMGVAAYYDPLSNRVVLKAEANMMGSGRKDLEEQELISTIAHEGCHQLLYNIGVQQRLSRWPMWLGEGIAEYMAPTEPGRNLAWKGAGHINNMRLWELETFLQKQVVKTFDGDTVDMHVRAAVLDSKGYAASWTITHYLAREHKNDFDRYMQYLSRLAPMKGMILEEYNLPAEERPEWRSLEDVPKIDHNMTHFKAFFNDDIKQLENEMIKYMASSTKKDFVSPVADYPHVVGLALIPGVDGDKRFACFFLNPQDVAEWHQAIQNTLTDYQKEHVEVYTSAFANRAEANKVVTKFLDGKFKPNAR